MNIIQSLAGRYVPIDIKVLSKWITTYLVLFVSTLTLFSQTGIEQNNFRGVDSTINLFLKNWDIKGGAVAITKDGKLVYNRAFGFTNQNETKIAKPHDLFRIASVSKPITSIAVMKLIELGKLSVTDTVFGDNKLIRDPYYLGAISDSRIFNITVQNLLEHTAGWERKRAYENYSSSDPPFFPLLVAAQEDVPNPVGDSTLIRFSLKKGLDYEPGTTYSYSNVGFLVLGKIIEKVTGMKYENYISSTIFKPLAIDDIHLGKNLLENRQERETEYISSLSTLSCYGNGCYVPWQYGGFNLEAMNAHGGWIASASDLSRLILAVDGSLTSPDILSPETVAQMTTPGEINKNYAKGWSVNSRGNWWHTGSLDGTSAFIGRTSGGYTWAFLFNSRADNSTSFWNALDRLPWNCLKTVKEFPNLNLFPPLHNVTGLVAEVVSDGNIKVSWKKGDGDGRIIVVSEKPALEEFPEDGLSYFGESKYGEGSQLSENSFVVYNGFGTNTMVTGLNPKKVYYVSGFEYYINSKTGYYEVYKLGARENQIVFPHLILKPSAM